MSTFIVTVSNTFCHCKGRYNSVGQYYATQGHLITLLLNFIRTELIQIVFWVTFYMHEALLCTTLMENCLL